MFSELPERDLKRNRLTPTASRLSRRIREPGVPSLLRVNDQSNVLKGITVATHRLTSLDSLRSIQCYEYLSFL